MRTYSLSITLSIFFLVFFAHIFGIKMLLFGVCAKFYFVKLSAGIGVLGDLVEKLFKVFAYYLFLVNTAKFDLYLGSCTSEVSTLRSDVNPFKFNCLFSK